MADIVVTTTSDVVSAGDGVTSLREAVQQANGNAGPDTIIFATGLDAQTLQLTSGALIITGGGLTIDGDLDDNGAADIRIEAVTSHFIVAQGASATLDGLILQGGDGASLGATPGYGSILNRGTLTVTNGVFADNNVSGLSGDPVSYANGENGGGAAGAILNFGALTVAGTSFNANRAYGGGASAGDNGISGAGRDGYRGGQGGVAAAGILNMVGATLAISGSTFQDQIAYGGNGGAGGMGADNAGGGGGSPGDGGDGGAGGAASLGIVNFGTLTGDAARVGGAFDAGDGGIAGQGGPPSDPDGVPGRPGVSGDNGAADALALGFGTNASDSHAFSGGQTYFARGGNDTVTGGAGVDLLYGEEGDDTLDAGVDMVVDTLEGGDQNDRLIGERADKLFGGQGDDTLGNRFVEGDALFDGGGGEDTLDFSLDPGTAGTYDLTLLDGFTNDYGGIFKGFEHLIGSVGNETMIGTSIANRLSGGGGNDTLSGGTGNDSLDGGNGTDRLEGGVGNDTYANAGADTVIEYGGEGTDTMRSDFTVTALATEVERLFLTGTAAINGSGNYSDNTINGNTANNLIAGLTGNDTLQGAAGGDTLQGATGADRLIGGTQRDKLVPGIDSDRDVLVFNVSNDSTGVTRDVIDRFDFNAEDKVDLPGTVSAVRTLIAGGNLSTATFNADLTAAVTAAKLGAGQAVLFDPSGGNQDLANTVYLIVDANGVAGYQANQDWVFQIENCNTAFLDKTDFI